jgi:hypothetical protein
VLALTPHAPPMSARLKLPYLAELLQPTGLDQRTSMRDLIGSVCWHDPSPVPLLALLIERTRSFVTRPLEFLAHRMRGLRKAVARNGQYRQSDTLPIL